MHGRSADVIQSVCDISPDLHKFRESFSSLREIREKETQNRKKRRKKKRRKKKRRKKEERKEGRAEQTHINPSCPQLSSSVPSLLNSTPLTGSLCAGNTRRHLPFFTLHNLIVSSKLPLANRLPCGEKAKLKTKEVCPFKILGEEEEEERDGARRDPV